MNQESNYPAYAIRCICDLMKQVPDPISYWSGDTNADDGVTNRADLGDPPTNIEPTIEPKDEVADDLLMGKASIIIEIIINTELPTIKYSIYKISMMI